jgi:hypothetical protein
VISVVLSFSCVFVGYCYCVAKIMPVVIPWTFLQSQTNVVEEVSCDSQAVNNLCDIPVKGDIAQAAQAQSSSTATKTFAQALSNSRNIPTSKLAKPCLKGEQVSIKITESEYLADVLDCQNVLHERFTLPKGSSPVRMQDLKERILKF